MTRSIFGLSLLPLFVSTAMFAQVEAAERITPEARPFGSGHIAIPQSGLRRLEDVGRRSNTQFKILVPAGRPEGVVGFSEAEVDRDTIQPLGGYNAETPASLACLYGLVALTSGCNP